MILPVRKCYHAAKVGFLLILVVTIFSLFEKWRGGKRTASADTHGPEDEYEKQILEDEARIVPGLGEGGEAAHLFGEAKRLGEESEKKLAINVYLSDRIAYNRTLKDYRNPACERVVYDAELPSASVILIFHNEPYSVVVRTIWSVINSARRDQPWYKKANYFDRETGRTMTLGYPGQDPTSPFVYLKEIILVDDNSTLPELKGKLSHYVRTRLPPDLIRILRLPDRVGLTRARLAGARYASGDALVFLDSHCEVQRDWLRPLLHRIKESRRAVVVPIIDVIEASNFYYSVEDPVTFQGLMLARMAGARAARGDVLVFLDAHCEAGADWLRPLLQRAKHKRDAVLAPLIDVLDQTTFQLEAAQHFQVGGFTFMGHFTWIDVPEREKKRRGSDIAPTWSPTMAGGLFAISRAYYWEVGAYDEQMAGWGGENLEMSFRVWQCGGTLETIPCSRVGHVFRSFHPYGMPASTDTHGINTARMAEVWMDDYAELFYLHRPDLRKSPKIGDVTHRRVLREKLQCKSFQWYLDNVYKEKFVPVRDVYGFGRFMNPASGLCLDTLQREGEALPLGLYSCHERLEATQYFALSLKGELRDEEKCAEVQYSRSPAGEMGEDLSRRVLMVTCHGKQRGQKWRYLADGQLQHIDSGLCLAGTASGSDAVAVKCRGLPRQRWTMDYSELNNFRKRDDIEPTDQELKLQRLRGQRRISRSLLTYPEEEANSTRRHKTTHHRSSKKHKHRKSKKNKFILKLIRGANHTDEEHLEVDVYCRHRQLYPNNSFVRDLVAILNDKDIKVINNGRVFEHNRVSELKSEPPAPRPAPAEPPTPPAPDIEPLKPKRQKKRKHKKASIQPLASPVDEDAADALDAMDAATDARDAATDARDAATDAPAEKKIIIEDFVEVKPSTLTTKRVKKRKRVRPRQPAPAPAPRATAPPPADGPARDEAAPPETHASDERWPVLESRFRRNSTHARAGERRDHHLMPTFTRAQEAVDRRAEEPARGAPVKVVMRSNLTFNLGDEFFRWHSGAAADVANLLGELMIPANTSLYKQPASVETNDRRTGQSDRDGDNDDRKQIYNIKIDDDSEARDHKRVDSLGDIGTDKEARDIKQDTDTDRETHDREEGDRDDVLTGRGRERATRESSGSSESGGDE